MRSNRPLIWPVCFVHRLRLAVEIAAAAVVVVAVDDLNS